MRTALGIRAHSGWAAVVAVAGTLDAPRVLDRRRIVISDPGLKGSGQPYHAAAGLPLRRAEARGLAVEAISVAVQGLRSQGHEVAGCAILLGSGRQLPELEKILASHALIHTAEGEMFRDVLRSAAEECRLAVTGVREKTIDPKALARLASLGKLIGPPRTQDQKYATAAGLTVLG
jgi:hypothetical protein